MNKNENKNVNGQNVVNGQAQTEPKVVVNKTINRFKLLSAVKNKAEDKVGLFLLMYRNVLQNGQINLNGIETPLVSSWVPLTNFVGAVELLNMPVLSDVYAVVSGNGDFMKVHRILSVNEYELYLSMLNTDESTGEIVDE